MKTLVTTISFINHNKLQAGSEIYATYTNRLVNYTMENTKFDIRVATNRPDLFEENLNKYSGRFTLLVDTLENNKVQVGGAFNQLLKYLALTNIPDDYEYVLYLDGDTSIFETIDEIKYKEYIDWMNENNYTALLSRDNPEYMMQSLVDHERFKKEKQQNIENNEPNKHVQANMFSQKFDFYNVTLENIPELWKTAPLPDEHVLFFKNVEHRIQVMSDKIKVFNEQLIQQENPVNCSADMEAFELGVSATEAGFKIGPLNGGAQHEIFKIKYNGSNWERIKL